MTSYSSSSGRGAGARRRRTRKPNAARAATVPMWRVRSGVDMVARSWIGCVAVRIASPSSAHGARQPALESVPAQMVDPVHTAQEVPRIRHPCVPPPPRCPRSPPRSALDRPPPRLCKAAQGLPQTRQRADIHRQCRRRPLRLGLHPRRRRKVVRPCPLSPPPTSHPRSGLHLKENGTSSSTSPPPHSSPAATEVPGTFRVNGSAKRMRDLQAAFETPPRVRSPLPSPPLPSHSPPFPVRKVPRVEERTLHHPRRRQRLPTLSHPDARKFRPPCSSIVLILRPGAGHPPRHVPRRESSLLSLSTSLISSSSFETSSVGTHPPVPSQPLIPHQQGNPSTMTTS